MEETRRLTVGFGITGSFCTFSRVKQAVEKLKQEDYRVIPIFSEHAAAFDTRFGDAERFREEIELLTEEKGIYTIPEAEPIGPKKLLDLMIILPCTGNTLAKLANGITDTSVLMAAKAHLRNERPLLISISSNDALGLNLKNIGILVPVKNVFFVPFGQDDPIKKPNSLIAHTELIADAAKVALEGIQLQPILVPYGGRDSAT